jgi:hypothetical protein
MPPDEAAKLGLTLEVTPTLDEVLAPRLARMATMRHVVDGLTEAELACRCRVLLTSRKARGGRRSRHAGRGAPAVRKAGIPGDFRPYAARRAVGMIG